MTDAAAIFPAASVPEILGEDVHFNSCTKVQHEIWEGGLVKRCLPPSLRWLRANASWPPLSLAHIASIMSIDRVAFPCPPPGPDR